MPSIPLDIETLGKFSVDELAKTLLTEPLVEIEMTCWNIPAQDTNDIAYDYLKAIYIGEHLFPYCREMRAQEIRKEGLHPNTFIRFSFVMANVDKLLEQLMALSRLVGEDNDSDIMFELTEELDSFADYIEANEVHFPELERKYYEYLSDDIDNDSDD
ncbi:hypothetical protein FBR02_00130 [Anaerolineae bacterium CFX9]|nr:hypothetical protein [Anaerolineae bacterium CFX9]NOG48725.1 hypothetical protein [Chloroflexota bacterium]GIK76134.1 MAG: hypothetical protein BroJett021_51220 [Chloroflexota bacterium]